MLVEPFAGILEGQLRAFGILMSLLEGATHADS